MTSTNTGETDQLTVDKPTADTDTGHLINKAALFPWTSLSQEEILNEIQKGITNLTGPNKDSLKLLLPSAINTKVEEENIAKVPIDKASAANTVSTTVLTPLGAFPAIKPTEYSIRSTTPVASDQSVNIAKPTDDTTPTKNDQAIVNHTTKSESEQAWDRFLNISAHDQDSTSTTPAKVDQAITNPTPKSESEQSWDRFLGVSIQNHDSTDSTTAAAVQTSDATKSDSSAGQPHYDLEDLLEDSTSATITPEDATKSDSFAEQPHYDLEDPLEDSTSTTITPEDATLLVAAVEENHLEDREVRRAFWNGYEQGVEDAQEHDSSSGSGSDNPGSIDSISEDDDQDDRDEMENHDDYEQGYSDGYYDGQDDAYDDYSDYEDDYYD